MAQKIDNETIERWRVVARDWMAANSTTGATLDMVRHGVDAWTIAHRAGICREAYGRRDIVDAHIQTALEKIFPNAVFKDAKRY